MEILNSIGTAATIIFSAILGGIVALLMTWYRLKELKSNINKSRYAFGCELLKQNHWDNYRTAVNTIGMNELFNTNNLNYKEGLFFLENNWDLHRIKIYSKYKSFYILNNKNEIVMDWSKIQFFLMYKIITSIIVAMIFIKLQSENIGNISNPDILIPIHVSSICVSMFFMYFAFYSLIRLTNAVNIRFTLLNNSP